MSYLLQVDWFAEAVELALLHNLVNDVPEEETQLPQSRTLEKRGLKVKKGQNLIENKGPVV